MATSTTTTGQLTVHASFNEKVTSGIFNGQNIPIPLNLQAILGNGTAADQVDGVYAATLSFTASTAQDLDLQDLTTVFGDALSFDVVRAIVLVVKSTTDAATLTVTPGSSNGATNILATGSSLPLRGSTSANQGMLILVAPNTTGYAVDSTHKVLTLTPSAHAFDVTVIVAGVKS